MIKRLLAIGKQEIFMGSVVLFIMINIFNFLNYLYHFLMARILGPVDYGVLAVLMSLVYIFSVPSDGIQTVISRYTSKFNINKKYGKIKHLLIESLMKGTLVSVILFLIFIPVSFLYSYFVRVDVGLVIFTGILIFSSFTLPVTRGIIQGRKKFKLLGLSMVYEGILKIIIGLALVFFGLRVYGAISGYVLSSFLVLLISFLFIKEILNSKTEKIKIEKIYSYGFPVLIVVLTIMLMASMDVIFAKRFFPSEIAGKYAVASMLGKMIFFGTFAIGKAMFPLTSENYDKGKKTKSLFKKAFFMVAGLCFLALLVYLFFPGLVISILFGKEYVEMASILIFIGLAFSFLSLTNLSLTYALSIHKRKVSFFIVFVFVEVLFFLILNKTILAFTLGFLIANFIMFVASLIFVIKD